jgi:6-pyruvoyltetrahydropterin/6-carboxytetrahydropterin synthase
MPYTVGKEFTFDAAHQLPLHDGKCKNLHGHTYRVRVTYDAKMLIKDGPKSGMVIDFGDLKAVWKERIEPLVDHQFLNDTLPVPHTTAENIARWMLKMFREALGTYAGLTVTVYETPTSWATAS